MTNQNNKYFIFLVSILLIFLISLTVIERFHNTINKDYEIKLKLIDEKLKNLQEENYILQEKINIQENKIENINDTINLLEEKKNKIKEKYHDKIKNVDNLSDGLIDNFFTDRYK